MTRTTPFHVLVAGAGVAGLEAVLALHEHGAGDLAITLLAAEGTFTERPLAVALPFDGGHPRSVSVDAVAADAGAKVVRDTLAAVDPLRRTATTGQGTQIAYDA